MSFLDLRNRLSEENFDWLYPDECYFDNQCCIEKSIVINKPITLSFEDDDVGKKLVEIYDSLIWFIDHFKSDYYFYTPTTILEPMADGRNVLLCKIMFVERRHVDERRKSFEDEKNNNSNLS